ncbi:MAG TPA: tRNA pseudouridine(38-40) synthase TruA [Chloroflexia bacterium]|nr:tRNA pseudouridine(38-40) synthase TruA [Chloroflexia bacterium]
MRYKLTIEYDGKAFHGSQAQAAARGRTVQGELERALAQITGGPIRIALAGRTDAGVHAQGQVASFALDPAWPRAKLQRALNGVLPGDLAVRAIDRAGDDFHARYSATRRDYRYLIWESPVAAPLLRDRTWHVRAALDIAAMHEAAEALRGRHNFASFCGGGLGVPGSADDEAERPSTVRDMVNAACYVWPQASLYEAAPAPDGEGRLIAVDLAANAFLPQMVRTIVGSLVAVGQGKWTPAAFVDVLEREDRREAAATAPPQGLCLLRVWYERDGPPKRNT